MRRAQQNFVAAHDEGLRSLVLNSETALNLIRNIARLLDDNDAYQTGDLRHLTVDTRTYSAGVAVLEHYRGRLAGLRNELIERLDIVDFKKPVALHVGLS